MVGSSSRMQQMASARLQQPSGESTHSSGNLQRLFCFCHTGVLTWITYLYGIGRQPFQRLQTYRDDHPMLPTEVAERNSIVRSRKQLPPSHEERFEILLNALLGMESGTVCQRHPSAYRRQRQRVVFLRSCHPCSGISRVGHARRVPG